MPECSKDSNRSAFTYNEVTVEINKWFGPEFWNKPWTTRRSWLARAHLTLRFANTNAPPNAGKIELNRYFFDKRLMVFIQQIMWLMRLYQSNHYFPADQIHFLRWPNFELIDGKQILFYKKNGKDICWEDALTLDNFCQMTASWVPIH